MLARILIISYNHIHDFLPLNNITYMGGSLRLANDRNYCTTGLKLKVENIPAHLSYFLECTLDINLNAIASIKSIGGDFSLRNTKVTSLEGLNNLQSIGGIRDYKIFVTLYKLLQGLIL